MNKLIYKAFKKELEKKAAVPPPSSLIGTGVEKALHWMWMNPKATLGLSAAAVFLPKLLKAAFPAIILGSEHRKHGVMSEQTDVMKDILEQERLGNIKPRPVIPLYKKIEKPLV